MEDARFREAVIDQPLDPFHRRPIFLAPPPQRAPPQMGDMEVERGRKTWDNGQQWILGRHILVQGAGRPVATLELLAGARVVKKLKRPKGYDS